MYIYIYIINNNYNLYINIVDKCIYNVNLFILYPSK